MRRGQQQEIAVICAALLSALAACGQRSNSARPAVETPPAVAPVARQVSGVFLDAATGAPVSTPLTVTVRDPSGAVSALSRDATGAAKAVFARANGLLSFAVDPGAPLPVRLKMVASGDGYNGASADVLVERDGPVSFVASMVNVANPPPGVAVARQDAGTASGGVTRAPIVLATQPNAAGQALISLPTETRITTADGRPLDGSLQATVTHYSNAAATALAAFPGGLQASVPGEGGRLVDGAFTSGGFAAIRIADPLGNVAARFDKPLTVALDVPGTTWNAYVDPQRLVQAGDVIPFWSYDESTGQWSSEGTVTLDGPDASGNFTAEKAVTHLSYFNIDWFEEICLDPDTLTITGNDGERELELEISGRRGGYYSRRALRGDDRNRVSLAGLPSRSLLTLTALLDGSPVGSLEVWGICRGAELELPVVIPDVNPATLEAQVMRACREDPTRRSPLGSATVMLSVHGTSASPIFGSTDADGRVLFGSISSGLVYDISYAPLGGDFLQTSKTLAAGANSLVLDVLEACGGSGGPPPVPDRAPVITSLLAPVRALAAGESTQLSATATDPDDDPLSYAWSVSCPSGAQASLSAPGEATTDLRAATDSGAGVCTVTVEVSAKGLAATRTATVEIVPTGTIEVMGTFVPQPLVASVSLGDPASCEADRTNATCASHGLGVRSQVSGAIAFDAFAGPPSTSVEVTDGCGGDVRVDDVSAGSGAASFTWTTAATPGVCVLSVKLDRGGLSDQLPVAVHVSVQ